MTAELTPEEEAEIVLGRLDFKIDGKPVNVPELKWRANREWQARMQEAFASLVDVPSDTPEGQRSMGDVERDLVIAYDATGALGDLENATEREIDTIYNRLTAVSFPLADSPTAMILTMVQALVRAAAESARENTPSSPSPTGTSAPTPLRPRSPSARSSSFGPRPRNARRASSATG